MHVNNESKETQARNNAELQPNMMQLFTAHEHLNNSTSRTGATHTHVHTEPKRKGSRDFPERVEAFLGDRNSEPLRRGPRARAARPSCGPPDSTDGVLGETDGVFRRYLPARSRDSRAHARIERQKKGRLAGTTDKKQGSDIAGTKPRRPTNQPRRERQHTTNEPSSSVPFVERGSALRSAPFLAPPPLRGVSRKVSKGGVPPPWPRHTAYPPIGRRCATPPPSHQSRRRSG